MSNSDYIAIEPHQDDLALFACYSLMKFKPLVLSMDMGELTDIRKEETLKAMGMLDLDVVFINDFDLFNDYLNAKLIFTPALEGGHKFHDEVHNKTKEIFSRHPIIFYSTYRSRHDLLPFGSQKVDNTKEMEEIKLKVLQRYQSQIKATPCHFRVKCWDEYYK